MSRMLRAGHIRDHTLVKTKSNKKLCTTSQNHVKVFLKEHTDTPLNVTSIEGLPPHPDFDYLKFLGEFSSYLTDVVQIPSMNTYQSYISSVSSQITRKFPDLKPILADSYSRLRYNVTGDYIHDAVSNGRTPVVS